MFTFIHYPCMGPTYNESERMLHMVVMRRKICQKLITGGGKIMSGTIMTCLLTWDKMWLNWFENTAKFVIGEDGSVDCDAGKDFRVYWCDIKLEWDTVGDISRIIDHVSNLVNPDTTELSLI